MAVAAQGFELVPANNTCGFKGVGRDGGKFRAEVSAGERRYLGLFDTAEEAALAYARHVGKERAAAEAVFATVHKAALSCVRYRRDWSIPARQPSAPLRRAPTPADSNPSAQSRSSRKRPAPADASGPDDPEECLKGDEEDEEADDMHFGIALWRSLQHDPPLDEREARNERRWKAQQQQQQPPPPPVQPAAAAVAGPPSSAVVPPSCLPAAAEP